MTQVRNLIPQETRRQVYRLKRRNDRFRTRPELAKEMRLTVEQVEGLIGKERDPAPDEIAGAQWRSVQTDMPVEPENRAIKELAEMVTVYEKP